MTTESWFEKTIVAKSDQLNACDLIEPIVVSVLGVKYDKSNVQQPAIIQISGGYQPYKPNLTYRRVLMACWGKFPEQWIGRSMQLFTDPKVKFGGEEVGGVCISHLSHIDSDKRVQVNESRGKKKTLLIKRLETDLGKRVEQFIGAVGKAKTIEEVDALVKRGEQLYSEADEKTKQRIDVAVLDKRDQIQAAS